MRTTYISLITILAPFIVAAYDDTDRAKLVADHEKYAPGITYDNALETIARNYLESHPKMTTANFEHNQAFNGYNGENWAGVEPSKSVFSWTEQFSQLHADGFSWSCDPQYDPTCRCTEHNNACNLNGCSSATGEIGHFTNIVMASKMGCWYTAEQGTLCDYLLDMSIDPCHPKASMPMPSTDTCPVTGCVPTPVTGTCVKPTGVVVDLPQHFGAFDLITDMEPVDSYEYVTVVDTPVATEPEMETVYYGLSMFLTNDAQYYHGVQTFPDNKGRFLFSVFGGKAFMYDSLTPHTGRRCKADADGGAGVSCYVELPRFQRGHEYRISASKLVSESNITHSVFKGSVTDDTAGTPPIDIGGWVVEGPNLQFKVDHQIAFIEKIGDHRLPSSCDAVPKDVRVKYDKMPVNTTFTVYKTTTPDAHLHRCQGVLNETWDIGDVADPHVDFASKTIEGCGTKPPVSSCADRFCQTFKAWTDDPSKDNNPCDPLETAPDSCKNTDVCCKPTTTTCDKMAPYCKVSAFTRPDPNAGVTCDSETDCLAKCCQALPETKPDLPECFQWADKNGLCAEKVSRFTNYLVYEPKDNTVGDARCLMYSPHDANLKTISECPPKIPSCFRFSSGTTSCTKAVDQYKGYDGYYVYETRDLVGTEQHCFVYSPTTPVVQLCPPTLPQCVRFANATSTCASTYTKTLGNAPYYILESTDPADMSCTYYKADDPSFNTIPSCTAAYKPILNSCQVWDKVRCAQYPTYDSYRDTVTNKCKYYSSTDNVYQTIADCEKPFATDMDTELRTQTLDRFNELRKNSGIKGLYALTWDGNLECAAKRLGATNGVFNRADVNQKYIDCVNSRGGDFSTASLSSTVDIGVNWDAMMLNSTRTIDLQSWTGLDKDADAIKAWSDEKVLYDRVLTGKSVAQVQAIGHYAQIVSSRVVTVGCYDHVVPAGTSDYWGSVCLFMPGGNILPVPFKDDHALGAPCDECKYTDASVLYPGMVANTACHDGLCQMIARKPI